MEALICNHFPPLLPKSRPPPILTPIPNKFPSFLNPSLQNHRQRSNLVTVFCSIPACSYGGWEDDLDESGRHHCKPDPIRSFLITAGIDRRHALVFFLGFVSALTVFRARFSSMVVIPISILAFVAGFSAGAAQAGGVVGLLNQIGRGGGEFASFDEKKRELGEFLDDLGSKMTDLKNGLEDAIDSNSLDVGSIKSYLDVVEMVKSVAVDTKRSIEGSVEKEAGKKSRLSRKRREEGVDGFDFVQYLSGMFEDCLIGLRPPKAKDTNRGEPVEELNLPREGNAVTVGSVKGSAARNEFDVRYSKQMPNNNFENPKAGTMKGDASEKVVPDNPVVNTDIPVERNGEKSHYGIDGKWGDDMLSYDDELNSLSRTSHFTAKRGSFEKLVFKQIYKGQTVQNGVRHSASHGRRMAESMDFFNSESGASSLSEKTLEMHDESYFLSHERRTIVSKNEREISFKQGMAKPEERPILDGEQPTRGTQEDSAASSSKTLADEEFNQNVKEATNLLKLARECMVKQADEERADSMLYKSARLLSTAVALKPMSLLAMGQLGNTCLLHGELKLKVSRELRTLLLRNDGLLNGKGRGVRLNKLDTHALSRENITSVLVDVCEECDGLLVEAGRKYRKALAIDGNDIRALYNWGLALSFRAQLIADIGPEAAIDADKVYLAAIDKFNAMTSRSNAYAPDALYRWGIALQRRSQLRPDSSREKIKLLQQAKSLFEDVLCVESDNKMVREALASCLSELDYSRQW